MAFGSSTKAETPAFIVNRNAGRFRRDRGLEARVRGAAVHGKVFATETKDELDRAVASALDMGASPVVFCGGDGTYLAGVTALARAANGAALPPVALGRAGTVSIVAKNWGAARDVVATVRAVAEHPTSLRFTPRPTLSVEADGVARVGFTFGTGLVANFFDEYDRASPGGLGAALRIVTRVFVDSFRGGDYATKILGALPCRIHVDGVALAPAAWSLVLCSVLRDVGLHMLVTHRAGEDPSRPHLVASPLAPRALGPQWPLVAMGKRLIGASNFDGLVGSFRVDFPERGPFVLDGDTFHARTVTVGAGPRLLVAT
ncbi:MAG TPA: diacylglycerol kinase family protein [Polyangiaceae bacterium]|jgi:hypothetical protein|nr:diacylglycerol kinase family protein [Polyangiaceae bacterium]